MAIAPFATYRPLQNHDGGKLKSNAGLVLHVQAGNGSCYDVFKNSVAPNRKSSHFWISKTGLTEQYLDTCLEAWAQGTGNAGWVSVETEGFPTESLTDAQVSSLAQLYRWGHDVHGWRYQLADVPQACGFGWHGMGGSPWGHPLCPGLLRRNQRQHILDLAQIPTLKKASAMINGTAVKILPTPAGYYIVASDGGVFAYGDAKFYGAMGGQPLNAPITDAALTPSGNGYYLLGGDAGVFAYGDAEFIDAPNHK